MPDARTFLFADMAGFTALTEVMGDEEAVGVAEDFFADARALLPGRGATEIKTIGDAMMIEVVDAGEAISLGVALAQEIGVRHEFPSIRVGMHTGEAVQRGDDWFGAAVNLAARVSGAAAGCEVLLTESTQTSAGEVAEIEFVEHGLHTFRNVADPVLLFRAVALGGDRDAAGLPIDPVCRMAIDPGQAAGQLLHEGREYHFCSLDCVQRFAQEPQRFTAEDDTPR